MSNEEKLTDSIRNKQPTLHTVAETILEQLRLWDVKRIYGVIGDAIFGLLDAIAKQKEIEFIAVKHESVAALMASAEAKCTGGLGVCVSQMGPGLANLINGLGDAYLDQSPVLAITGQAPLAKIGTSYKQFINQQELVQAVSGYSELIVHPDAIVDSLTKAIYTSFEMETVSHISVPTDVFTMSTLVQTNTPAYNMQKGLCAEQLEQGLCFMHAAKRPMILIGNNVRHIGPEIQQLAEHWGSGLVMGYGAVGIIPATFPYALGGIGEGGNPFLTDLFKESDVVLAIGTSWWPKECTPTNASIIQVQNKQIKLGNGMPVDCGITGNIEEIILELDSGLASYDVNQNWVDKIKQCQQTWLSKDGKEGEGPKSPLHPSSIVNSIERCSSTDTIIALDEGDSTLWFMGYFREQCAQVLLSRHWRTMGAGLPAALAAKLCMPEKHVICITGDGGLAMVLADLLTATRYQLQITLVVFNNGALQMEENKMVLKGLIPLGTELTNPDYTKLAEACGWEAYKADSTDELERLLKTAQKCNKPVLIDVPTAKVTYPNYQQA